jgi:hypothetical protein
MQRLPPGPERSVGFTQILASLVQHPQFLPNKKKGK